MAFTILAKCFIVDVCYKIYLISYLKLRKCYRIEDFFFLITPKINSKNIWHKVELKNNNHIWGFVKLVT